MIPQRGITSPATNVMLLERSFEATTGSTSSNGECGDTQLVCVQEKRPYCKRYGLLGGWWDPSSEEATTNWAWSYSWKLSTVGCLIFTRKPALLRVYSSKNYPFTKDSTLCEQYLTIAHYVYVSMFSSWDSLNTHNTLLVSMFFFFVWGGGCYMAVNPCLEPVYWLRGNAWALKIPYLQYIIFMQGREVDDCYSPASTTFNLYP